jgi:hypothetical protein
MLIRGPAAQRLIDSREQDLLQFVDFTVSAPVQQSLDAYMAALKARKK